MAAYLAKVRRLLVKKETTLGTYASPVAGTDDVLARSIEVSIDPGHNARPAQWNKMAELPGVPGKKVAKISYVGELRYNGAVAGTHEQAPLFEACACSVVETAGPPLFDTVTPLNPGDAGFGTGCSIDVVSGPKLWQFKGCMGSYKISGKAGEIITLSVDLQGLVHGDADGTLGAPTYDAPVTYPGIVAKGGTLSIGAAAALLIRDFELDIGNSVVMRDSEGATDGVFSAYVTPRKVRLSMTLEPEASATYDPTADYKASTSRAISLAFGATGNKMTIAMGAARLAGYPSEEMANGLVAYKLVFETDESAGNPFTIKLE